MDALSTDLTLALEESSKILQQTVKRYNRKRKGKNRRSHNDISQDLNLKSIDYPNRSEASTSSDYLESYTIIQHQPEQVLKIKNTNIPFEMSYQSLHSGGSSITFALPLKRRERDITTDSDADLIHTTRNNLLNTTELVRETSVTPTLTTPIVVSSVISGAEVESDSVNELCFEKKSTDHARRKRRAKLNASPQIVLANQLQEMDLETKKPKHRPKKPSQKDIPMDTLTGKRPMEIERASCFADTYYSDSSILTSDGEVTCDERAGEADDEQSDFFHEIGGGPTYGIPVPRNNRYTMTNAGCFQRVIYKACPSENSSVGKRTRRMRFNKYTRQFPLGQRKTRHPQHQRKTRCSTQNEEGCYSNISLTDRHAKRRKKYMPHYNNNNHNSDLVGNLNLDSFRVPDWKLSRSLLQSNDDSICSISRFQVLNISSNNEGSAVEVDRSQTPT